MNRQEIIKTLKESDLNLKELWFGFGGGLVMHGLKDNSKDIDAQISSSYFQELVDKGHEWKEAPMGGRMIVYSETVDLFETFEKTETTEIEGIQVETLETIIKRKLQRGREKDLKDVEMIRNHMN